MDENFVFHGGFSIRAEPAFFDVFHKRQIKIQCYQDELVVNSGLVRKESGAFILRLENREEFFFPSAVIKEIISSTGEILWRNPDFQEILVGF